MINMTMILQFYAILSLIVSAHAATYTIVIPPVNTGGQEAALIVAPGAEILGEDYQSLCVAVQKATPLQLWVAITSGFRQNTVDPISLEIAVYNAKLELELAGMDKTAPVFLAGHSLGGTFSQLIVHSDPTGFAGGLILWASYLTAQTADLGAFPAPVYHVSGDLDGLTRMTRIGRAFRELSELMITNPEAEYTKSVVIMNGINHGQFATGEMPPNVINNDITSELSQTEALDTIAAATVMFMESVLGDTKAKELLHKAVDRTNITFNPLFMSEDFQAVGSSSDSAIFSQELVAGVPIDLASDFIVTSTLYDDQTEFDNSVPSLITDVEGKTVAGTTSKITYPRNRLDNTFIEESAVEIATKMKNQLAVKQVLGDGQYGLTLNCKEINEEVFNWALQMASPEVAQRYNTYGRKVIYNTDIQAQTESEWSDSPLQYAYTVDGDLIVTSTSYTSPQLNILNTAGVYHCKQLSPYRAMEWIYVDSLRPYN